MLQRPFCDVFDIIQTPQKMMSQDYKRIQDTLPLLKEVVEYMLQPNPKDRITLSGLIELLVTS